MKESDIERYLHEQVTALGGTTRKWVSPGHRGVPDRIVFLNGRQYFVETKVHDGKLSPMQKREIKKLIEHGAIVLVFHRFYDVDYFIEKYKKLRDEKLLP